MNEPLSIFDVLDDTEPRFTSSPPVPLTAPETPPESPPADLVLPAVQGDALFDLDEYDDWRELWVDMPAYDSQDQKPADSINVQFATHDDRRQFLLMMGEDPLRRKSIWYPSVKYLTQSDRGAAAQKVPLNRYPIYIPSKGRWGTPLTIRALERLGLPFSVVVQSQEAEAYAQITDAPLLILPGPIDPQVGGLVVARNFCWQHARDHGHARHWMLDDNLDGFYRLNDNLKYRVVSENPFSSVEDWTDRYQNVPISGLQYEFFADRRAKNPPLRLNTRVYSCYLIDTEVASRYQWRGPYNDDTDFCLRLLKDGYVTALFNHYLCKKMPTMKLNGGNTDDLYKIEDGRLKMAQALQEWHPDVCTVTEKWGRPQHHVNYERFKGNRLIPREES